MVKDKGEARSGKFSVRREGKIESCNHEEVNWVSGKPKRASENLSEGRRGEYLGSRRPSENLSKIKGLSENLGKSKGLSENLGTSKGLNENLSKERRLSENMGFGGEDAVRGPRRRSEMRVEIEVSRRRRMVMMRMSMRMMRMSVSMSMR